MKIYLIRHGETDANSKKIHQYSSDPLSTEGIKQAEILAKRLLIYDIDVILSSPYERSKQTAEIINKYLNKDIEYVELLREIKRPSEIEGKSIHDEEVIRVKEIIDENAHEPDFRYSDEETFFDFKKRVTEVLEKLSKRNEENILVSTHGQVIVMLFCVIIFGDKLTADNYHHLRSVLQHYNSGITEINYLHDNWSLITWNDIRHL